MQPQLFVSPEAPPGAMVSLLKRLNSICVPLSPAKPRSDSRSRVIGEPFWEPRPAPAPRAAGGWEPENSNLRYFLNQDSNLLQKPSTPQTRGSFPTTRRTTAFRPPSLYPYSPTSSSTNILTNMKLPFAVALLAASAAAFTPSAVAPRTVSASSLK